MAAAALAALSSLVRHEPTPKGDDLIYERMAEHPLATHTFPFAYRLGLPWLVHILPFSHTTSFTLLAWLAAGGAAGVAFILMREAGASAELATSLAVALALSPPLFIVALRAGRNTDAATVFFMMAAVLLLVRRRLILLSVILAVGVLFREAELFVIPLIYVVLAESRWDYRALRSTICVSIPVIALYVALHFTLHTSGNSYGGSAVGGRLALISMGLESAGTELRRLFTIYGPLWFVAPLALLRMPFARQGLVLVAGSLVSMAFALDWGRMILLSAPVFYPASAFVLARHRRWQVPVVAAFGVLIAAYAVYMDYRGVRTGIINTAPPPYPIQ